MSPNRSSSTEKFKPEDLKNSENRAYVRDLGECFKILQKWGFEIIWVEDGAECMRAIKQWPSDIRSVIVETYIPGGGFTVARLIRFNPDWRHIPVFLMSSQPSVYGNASQGLHQTYV